MNDKLRMHVEAIVQSLSGQKMNADKQTLYLISYALTHAEHLMLILDDEDTTKRVSDLYIKARERDADIHQL